MGCAQILFFEELLRRTCLSKLAVFKIRLLENAQNHSATARSRFLRFILKDIGAVSESRGAGPPRCSPSVSPPDREGDPTTGKAVKSSESGGVHVVHEHFRFFRLSASACALHLSASAGQRRILTQPQRGIDY